MDVRPGTRTRCRQRRMIITAIERKRGPRQRAQVYVDRQPLFELARDTTSKLGLRPGHAIEQSEIEAMVAADQRRGAFETAVAMLARRPHSEREIRRRLMRGRYDVALIDGTVERLHDLKLLDDAEFARAWVESRDRSRPRGHRLLNAELRALGVENSVAREAVTFVSEIDAAYRVAMKRMRTSRSDDHRAFRDRLGPHLQRRGFSWDVITATLERCWREQCADSTADDSPETME